MPHGGPIGVADLRDYDANVHYLARSGFAVLQVNDRGSSGKGRAFEEAGYRQWGRGIEEDIETAIDQVVATGRVDGERMCAIGSSYGGCSALMLVIRNPDRIRVPVYLARGAWDRTVDVDPLYRMRLALELARVPGKATVYAEMGHGFPTRDLAVRYWVSLYDFLAEHLKR